MVNSQQARVRVQRQPSTASGFAWTRVMRPKSLRQHELSDLTNYLREEVLRFVVSVGE